MGLRSRRRRLAGMREEDTYDIEGSQQTTASLQDHLQASRSKVDDFNLSWKRSLRNGGFIVGLYSIWNIASFLANEASQLNFLLLLIWCTSFIVLYCSYAYTNAGQFGEMGLLFAGISLALWFFGTLSSAVAQQAFPAGAVYFICSWLSIQSMGNNTTAELAREQQLLKLEKLARSQ